MQALPLIISAAGTAATIYGEQEQRQQQRDVLNRQLARDDAASQQSNQQVLQEGQRYTTANRQQALQDAADKTYGQMQTDLAGAGGADIGTAANDANVSNDFLTTKAARAIEEGQRLTDIARETAKARAPGQLQLLDSQSMANLAGNLQNLWGTTKNMAGATNLDAQGVTLPAAGQLGKVASAVGAGMAYGGYGQGAGVQWDPDGSYARKYALGAGR